MINIVIAHLSNASLSWMSKSEINSWDNLKAEENLSSPNQAEPNQQIGLIIGKAELQLYN